jgi:RNA polymerase sigma-70 factor (ECF subfamily)
VSSSINHSLPFFAFAGCVDAPIAGGLKAPTDEELLLRLEAKDFSAVDLLFDRYATKIFSIGLRTLHDRGEAEDLVQDVFLHLYEKARGFDALRGSAQTWILQIAYRRAFDRHAYLRRRNHYHGSNSDVLMNTLCSKAERECDLLVSANELRSVISELSDKQRLTLQMFFYEDLDLREISTQLGEAYPNVRHAYYRGLENLRRKVNRGARQ